MRNLKYNILSVDNYIDATKAEVSASKLPFINLHEPALKNSYKAFLERIHPCTLETLTPVWPELAFDPLLVQVQKKLDRDTMSKLYDNSDKQPYWDELIRQNDGTEIMCPICGIRISDQLDHYIPREKMPEFSLFAPNIIPICNKCNGKKLAKWLSPHGQRLIFNAFYDELPDKPICECVIDIDNNGLPQASIMVSSQLDNSNPIDNRILTTIDKLNLVTRWQGHCKRLFLKALIKMIRKCQPVSGKTVEDRWKEYCDDLKADVSDSTVTTYIEGVMYIGMINSQVLKKWICDYWNGQLTPKLVV